MLNFALFKISLISNDSSVLAYICTVTFSELNVSSPYVINLIYPSIVRQVRPEPSFLFLGRHLVVQRVCGTTKI